VDHPSLSLSLGFIRRGKKRAPKFPILHSQIIMRYHSDHSKLGDPKRGQHNRKMIYSRLGDFISNQKFSTKGAKKINSEKERIKLQNRIKAEKSASFKFKILGFLLLLFLGYYTFKLINWLWPLL